MSGRAARFFVFLPAFLPAFLAACGCGAANDAAREAEAEAESEAEGESEPDLAPPTYGIQVPFPEIKVGAGEDFDTCYFFELPADERVDVVRFDSAHLGYTHHFILSETTIARDEGYQACPDLIGSFVDSKPIFPGTREQPPVAFPDGVCMQLAPHARMYMNLHLVNPTTEAVSERFVVNFEALEPGAACTPADIMAGATTNFAIPPREEHVVAFDCLLHRDMNLFAMTSHAHARLTRFTVALWDGDVGDTIYDNDDWDEPLLEIYDDPIVNPTGFHVECAYDNRQSDETVCFGGLATDEMCTFFGYYWPAQGLVSCLPEFPIGGDCPP
ncbi:MAG: hypothetical protein AABZ30_01565 [Myxococcota bacterium]